MALEAMKRNGHNLHLGDYASTKPYDIPCLAPVPEVPDLKWIPFNAANTQQHRASCGIHFFLDDYIFERCWRDPDRYTRLMKQFGAVMSPDFSLFTDYPYPVQLYNHWRKHQLAVYWHQQGIVVIPSICWSDERSFDWCFEGEPAGSVVAVSSVGTQKNPVARRLFQAGYEEMCRRLKPCTVIFYGDVPKVCKSDDIRLISLPAYHHSLANDAKVR